MKVMCIDDSSTNAFGRFFLKYGETYFVDGEMLNVEGTECYLISSLPNSVTTSGIKNNLPLYLKKRFVPLSDIDETEMERNYQSQTLTQ